VCTSARGGGGEERAAAAAAVVATVVQPNVESAVAFMSRQQQAAVDYVDVVMFSEAFIISIETSR